MYADRRARSDHVVGPRAVSRSVLTSRSICALSMLRPSSGCCSDGRAAELTEGHAAGSPPAWASWWHRRRRLMRRPDAPVRSTTCASTYLRRHTRSRAMVDWRPGRAVGRHGRTPDRTAGAGECDRDPGRVVREERAERSGDQEPSRIETDFYGDQDSTTRSAATPDFYALTEFDAKLPARPCGPPAIPGDVAKRLTTAAPTTGITGAARPAITASWESPRYAQPRSPGQLRVVAGGLVVVGECEPRERILDLVGLAEVNVDRSDIAAARGRGPARVRTQRRRRRACPRFLAVGHDFAVTELSDVIRVAAADRRVGPPGGRRRRHFVEDVVR